MSEPPALNHQDEDRFDELLTIEEFAERMKIGRTTVFKWIQDGSLVPGKHFLKIGRVCRFHWPRILHTLAVDNLTQAAVPVAQTSPAAKTHGCSQRKTTIDLHYD